MEAPDRLSGRCSLQFGDPTLAGPGSGSEVPSQKGWGGHPTSSWHVLQHGSRRQIQGGANPGKSDGRSGAGHTGPFFPPSQTLLHQALGFLPDRFSQAGHREQRQAQTKIAFRRPEGHRAGVESRGGAEPTSLCSVGSPGCLLTNDSTGLGKSECPQTSVSDSTGQTHTLPHPLCGSRTLAASNHSQTNQKQAKEGRSGVRGRA